MTPTNNISLRKPDKDESDVVHQDVFTTPSTHCLAHQGSAQGLKLLPLPFLEILYRLVVLLHRPETVRSQDEVFETRFVLYDAHLGLSDHSDLVGTGETECSCQEHTGICLILDPNSLRTHLLPTLAFKRTDNSSTFDYPGSLVKPRNVVIVGDLKRFNPITFFEMFADDHA